MRNRTFDGVEQPIHVVKPIMLWSLNEWMIAWQHPLVFFFYKYFVDLLSQKRDCNSSRVGQAAYCDVIYFRF